MRLPLLLRNSVGPENTLLTKDEVSLSGSPISWLCFCFLALPPGKSLPSSFPCPPLHVSYLATPGRLAMGCTSSGTSLQEWGVGYGLVAVGRASGDRVTGRGMAGSWGGIYK